MKIAAISDTHGKEWLLPRIPDADILVVAGDTLGQGMRFEFRDFVTWCLGQPVDDIIIVAGNHDFFLESADEAYKVIAECQALYREKNSPHAPNVHYLCDSGVVIKDVKFWGSPWTPAYGDWAFMKEDEELVEYWLQIPDDTDVLITHGPPKDILDTVLRPKGYGLNVGSSTLRTRISQVKPRLHIFGHIHEHGGVTTEVDGTKFCNVAMLTERYQPRLNAWTLVEV
jgi:Icc-related predicted phosphoesterase